MQAALAYAEQGYDVLPLDGKEPRTRHGHKGAKKERAAIRQWWTRNPDANIGIAIPPGVVVLDVDPRNGGSRDALGSLPDTPTARTGGGGHHAWFKLPAGVQVKPLGKGIDIKANGYVVAPPSIHPNGEAYAWLTALDEVGIAELPEHLRAEPKESPTVGQAKQTTVRYWLGRAIAAARVGTRDNTCYGMASQLRDAKVPIEDALGAAALYQAAVPQDDHLYTIEDARRAIRSAYAGERRPPASNVFSEQSTSVVSEGKRSEAKESEEITTQGAAFLPGEDEGDWELDSIPDETYRDLMRQMRDQVDCAPMDGDVRDPGSPANRRNNAQHYLIRKGFARCFPDAEPLARTEISRVLNLVRQQADDGREGFYVLEKMVRALEGHELGRNAGKPIKLPRAWLVNIVTKALVPAPRAPEAVPAIPVTGEELTQGNARFDALMQLRWRESNAAKKVLEFQGRPDAEWEAFYKEAEYARFQEQF
jgi:hypothetical protein